MSNNPYESPTADQAPTLQPIGSGGFIRHRAFAHATSFWGVTLTRGRDSLRKQAEEFINTQVGADNVIAIVEQESPPTVVVWYRET